MSLKAEDVTGSLKFQEHYNDMPFVRLKEGYAFQVNPSLLGACFRFGIQCIKTNKTYSIYYDAEDALGYVGEPYYEVYDIQGDALRFLDIDELIWCIYEDNEDIALLRQEEPDRYV